MRSYESGDRMTMRFRRALLGVLILLAVVPAEGEELTRAQALQQLNGTSAQARRGAIVYLGKAGAMPDVPPLLEALRDSDAEARREAEAAIWLIWSRSGDAKIDALFGIGIEQMQAGNLGGAIATFTRIIELKPDFAEGWNKRATLYFLIGDYRKSLFDCDRVIERNPQHFGVLAGYAQIHARLGAYDRALDYARRALDLNPNLSGVRESIEVLERLDAERRRRTT